MKTNKIKFWKCLKCVKEFSRRFDLVNVKYLSIFLGFFARIVKVTHFAQVVKFLERGHGKIDPRKVDKSNRESTFSLFFCFFNTTARQSLLSLLQHNSKNKKFVVPSFFLAFVFQIGSLPMRLQRVQIRY